MSGRPIHAPEDWRNLQQAVRDLHQQLQAQRERAEAAESDRDEAVGLLRVLTAQGVNVADFQQAMAGTRAFLARLPSATEGS